MFEVPEAKRVRRDEIVSPPSSVPSSPEPLPEDGHALLGKLLDFDTFTVEDRPSIEKDTEQTAQNNGKDAAAEEQEQEFEFRLFGSGPAKRTQDDGQKPDAVDSTVNKDGTRKLRIRIRSPTPGPVDPNEGKFVNPFRGWQYYFTTPALMSGQHAESDPTIAAKRKEYEEVAVNGRQLLELAGKGTWPGCHLPWRVIHLKPSNVKLPRAPTGSSSATSLVPADSQQSKSRKKKPGKKRRIMLRKRAAAAEAAKRAEAEKRHQRNREKKIKRRQRERERKAAAAAAAAAAATSNTSGEAPGAAGGSGSGTNSE
ncbi:hypothetical protein VTN96DRAFT_6173 [Rasamsonia emersonii]